MGRHRARRNREIVVKSAEKQNEPGLEQTEKSFSEERRQAERDRARMNRQSNAKEKYKDKENGSKK